MAGEAWELMGRAIKDYWRGNPAAAFRVFSDYAGLEEYPAQVFFRTEEELPAQEEYALSLCRGRVLDVGAGSGCHSLILQRNDLSVTALDISRDAVAVMRERGIANAVCNDIRDFQAEPFDTLLMLMNGIGLAGDLPGLRRFLNDLKRLVKPAGQILLDSADLRLISEKTPQRDAFPMTEANYFGSLLYQIEYQGDISAPFRWLYLDQRTLRKNAAACGWDCQIIYEEGYQYLARLTRNSS